MIAFSIFLLLVVSMTALAATATTDPSPSGDPLPNFDRMWDYAHPDATERKFHALLAVAENSGDLSYLLQLQTQIALPGVAGKV